MKNLFLLYIFIMLLAFATSQENNIFLRIIRSNKSNKSKIVSIWFRSSAILSRLEKLKISKQPSKQKLIEKEKVKLNSLSNEKVLSFFIQNIDKLYVDQDIYRDYIKIFSLINMKNRYRKLLIQKLMLILKTEQSLEKSLSTISMIYSLSNIDNDKKMKLSAIITL